MLLWQLLFTLLYCLICNLFQTVSSNTNNIDEVCSHLAIQYGSKNIILQKQLSPLYNNLVWSIPNIQNINNNILVSYDQWTKSWEIMLPTTSSNTPNIYRVESVTTIPPSTIYTHKFTQEKLYFTTTCLSNTPSTDPSDLTYPKTATSCAEILSFFNNTIPNGIYEITIHNKIYQVYCAFDIENEFAWTLVESFSQSYALTLYSLSFNLGINPNNPIHSDTVYRLPIKQMQSIQSVSTHNLVTCNFDLSMTHDYLLLDTIQTGWNILTKTRSICREITELNIRGYQCNNGTAPFWTLSNHFHIDSSYDKCQCDQWIDTSIKNEDDFGQFRYFNRQHACAASNMSTTNYWMGNKVDFPSRFKSTCPETIDGCSELNLCTSCHDTCEYCQNLNSSVCGALNCMTCADINNDGLDNDYSFEILENDGTGICWNNNTYKSTCPPEIDECTPMNSCEECDDTCEYCQHPSKQKCTASDCITCDESYHLIPHAKYTYFPLGPHFTNTGTCHHNSTFKPTCPAGIKGCLPHNQCTQCHSSCQYCQSNAWGWLDFNVIMTCDPHECITCKDPINKFVQLREDGTGYCMNYTQPITTNIPCPVCENCTEIMSTLLPDITTMHPYTTVPAPDCSKCTLTTTPCPTNIITTTEPCDCTGTTDNVEPCNTEIRYVNVTVDCPDPEPATPCPTKIDGTTDMPNKGPTTSGPTTSPVVIIHEDCDYCVHECGMIYPPQPSVSPTIRPNEVKAAANYSVTVELRVEYENVHDLCPTDDSFGDYWLELSTCQILDIDMSFCEIVSITTIQTLPTDTNSGNVRRLVDEIDEFVIFIAMDISADKIKDFLDIERHINEVSFAGEVNQKWQINSANTARKITQIWTEYDIITPSPVEFTLAPSTTTTDYTGGNEFGVQDENVGEIGKPAAIGMVIGISIVLVLCACLCVQCRNKKYKDKSPQESDMTEGVTDAETNEDNDNEYSNISALPQADENGNQLERIDNGDEAEHLNIHHNIINMDNMNVDDEKEVEDNDYDGIGGGNGLDSGGDNEHSFNSILKMNGAAYFEDSDLRTQGALPINMNGTNMGPPVQLSSYQNKALSFAKQSGPVITQTQTKKYQELLQQEEFLSGLERQLNEIEQQSVNIGLDSHQEPGGSVDTLKTELSKLNANIKSILNNLGEELPASTFDDDTEEYDDIYICVEYSRFLNAILSKYGNLIIKFKQFDSDEMEIQELEEKRQKYEQMTKRSSKKVSKLYAMSKSGGKQKNIHSNSSSRSHSSQHNRHDSDNSELSDAQTHIYDKTNDNDIMNDFVMKPMKRNSKSYQKEQQKILQNMPSSPSVSGVSNLSNVPVQTPIMHPDILTLSSNNKKRGSRHEIDTDEYDTNNEDIIRHNDPPQYTITHKRDGYTHEAAKRMDTYGQLPTPSKSDTGRQYEDSDLKQNMEIINEQRQGLPQPINYDADNDYNRHRGISNVSGTLSNSDVGSLNSADSSDISPIKMIKKKNIKQDVDTGNVEYNADAPFEPSTTNTSQPHIINNNNISSTTSGSGSGSSGSGSSGSGGSTEDNDVKDNKRKKKRKPKKKVKGTGSKKSKFDTSFLKGNKNKSDDKSQKKWKYRGGGASEKDKKQSPKSKDKKKMKKKKSKKKVDT